METQYYNLIPPLAKSEELGPVSPGGSDDSGVQDEQPASLKPQRPPRSIDVTPAKLPKHSYINLGAPSSSLNVNLALGAPGTPPPSLPKRQPYLVQSPMLTHRNASLQRSASATNVPKRLLGGNRPRGVCKCKASGK